MKTWSGVFAERIELFTPAGPHALVGKTPSGLIRSLRLQRAEQLLRAGTVIEIAYSVGFKSVAHFSNAFHERYGERPSAFAARHRGR